MKNIFNLYKLLLSLVFFILCSNKNLYPQSDKAIIHINSNDIVYELSQQWYFKMDDNIEYKNINIDHHNWSFFYPHLPWEQFPGYKGYRGNSWYRLIIYVSKNITDLGLFVPRHYRGAQFYFNGVLIHQTRKFSNSGKSPPIIGKPDLIKIPTNLINRKNILAMRTGFLNQAGGFDGKIYIGPQNLIHKKWIKFIIWNIFLASINIFLGFYFFIYYRNRKEDRYYLYYSGLALSLGSWFLGYNGLILWVFDHQWVYIISTYIGSMFIPVMLINFIHSFFNYKKGLTARSFEAFYSFLIVSLLIEYILRGNIYYFSKYLYEPFMLSILLACTYSVYICYKGTKEKKPYARRIFAGTGIVGISAIVSILTFIDIIKFNPPILEGFFAMTIIFATVLAARFSSVHTELEIAHKELLEMDRMKDDFIASTSHELKTPLLGIGGIAESLIDNAKSRLGRETISDLSLIVSSARRLSNLVNDLLDLSRIKHKDLELQRGEVDIKQITDMVISLTSALARDKPVEFYNKIDENTPTLYCDENRLLQIMHNLIDNALKFTERGEISVYAQRMNDFVKITVEDTGIGVPADKIEKIFNFFEQADSSITRKYGGTGIGLSITKQLIELHGGKIHAESTEGKGSKFIFTMPLFTGQYDESASLKAAPEEIDPEKAQKILRAYFKHAETENLHAPRIIYEKKESDLSENRNKTSVLVIDDEPINLRVLSSQLTFAGYNVKTAAGGREALELLETSRIPDIILLDIMMPGMSGYELCSRLRERYTMHELPIIMITAKNQTADLVAGFETGANDYLGKPFEKRELLARVNNIIALKKTIKKYEKSRYKNLRERANPHFLFNAIHTIHALMRSNVKKADEAMVMLADIYRFQMDTSFQDLVPFDVEWEFVNIYLKFEKILFPETINFEMNKTGGLSSIMIPPLIIQPLVENSLKHGLRNKEDGGYIHVNAACTGNSVKISVEDNGTGLHNENPYARTLGNIKNMLRFHFNGSDVTIENRAGGGVIVTLTFEIDEK